MNPFIWSVSILYELGIIGYGSMGKILLDRFIDSISDNLYVANRTQEKLTDINNSVNICHSNAEFTLSVRNLKRHT